MQSASGRLPAGREGISGMPTRVVDSLMPAQTRLSGPFDAKSWRTAVQIAVTLPPSEQQVTVPVPQERNGFRSQADFLGLAACGWGLIEYYPFHVVTNRNMGAMAEG